MDKDTRWLRVQVPASLYNEIVRLAKQDDREPHVYLRRHLEREFLSEADPFVPPQVFPGLTDESTNRPPVCLHEGVEPGTPMGVVCPCPKCSTTC